MRKQDVVYTRGQLKIQEMAFVLVAIVIFFALVSLAYFSIRINSLDKDVGALKEDEAKEIVKKISGVPEFSFAEDCINCIDLDKVFVLKSRKSYQDFWNLDYLAIEKIYPPGQGECTSGNYPNCKSITIINSSDYGTAYNAYVSLCRHEFKEGGYYKCELGKIYVAGEGI
jgi:hypothetical protein